MVFEWVVLPLQLQAVQEAGGRTFCPDGDQLHPLARDELQSFVHVGNLMKAHFPSVWLG